MRWHNSESLTNKKPEINELKTIKKHVEANVIKSQSFSCCRWKVIAEKNFKRHAKQIIANTCI